LANQKSALFSAKAGNESLLCRASSPNTNGFAAKKYRHLTFIAFIFVSKYFLQVMGDVFCYAQLPDKSASAQTMNSPQVF
jgi:hypothetical protein